MLCSWKFNTNCWKRKYQMESIYDKKINFSLYRRELASRYVHPTARCNFARSTFWMLRYKPRDVTGISRAWEELLLNIVQVPYATEQARRSVEINFVSCFSAVSRKRGAGISNRVRAKRLSRLLPSAGSCTSAECVGGGPRRAGSNEAGIPRVLLACLVWCIHPGIVAPVIARARCDGRFRHAGVLEKDKWIEKAAQELILQRGMSLSGLFVLEKNLCFTLQTPRTPHLSLEATTVLHTGDHFAITRRAFAKWNRVCSPREFAHGRLCERATRSVAIDSRSSIESRITRTRKFSQMRAFRKYSGKIVNFPFVVFWGLLFFYHKFDDFR